MNDIIKNKLQILAQTRKQYWNIPEESGKFINMLIKSANLKNILEIGMSNGYSTIWMAEAAQEINAHITSLEFYEGRINEAKQNFEECKLSEYITVIQGSALLNLDNLNDTYDLIFIDANKSEYIEYFKKVHPKLKPNGIILADNTISHQKSTQPFLDEIFNHSEYDALTLPFDGGLTMARKKFKQLY